jgi:hypothetical protein
MDNLNHSSSINLHYSPSINLMDNHHHSSSINLMDNLHHSPNMEYTIHNTILIKVILKKEKDYV